MSEQNEPLRLDPQERIPSEPIRLESEDVFNSDLLGRPDPEFPSEMEAMIDNPMVNIIKPLLTQYFNAIMPKPPEPIKSEHKVRIFRLPALAKPKEIAGIESAIETLLNDGYCCHIPTVCNDYLIMDFSRRKEAKEE